MTTATAWLGALAYTLQIYFDFSGYSDMAIGLGRMIGFRLPENFDRPYSAVSITDFWRRWHMSLSRWFRDYVYIPLGGNRHGAAQTYRNLIIVFVAHRLLARRELDLPGLGPLPRRADAHRARDRDRRASPRPARRSVARRALTFLLVVVGWVFFRAESLGQALTMLRHMFVPSGFGLSEAVAASLTNQRSADPGAGAARGAAAPARSCWGASSSPAAAGPPS